MSNKNSITLLTLLFLILSSYNSFSQNTDWIRTYDTTLWKMDVTNTGDAIVTGTFKNSIQIGSTTFTAPDKLITQTYISKVDSNGNYIWAKQISIDTNGSNMHHSTLVISTSGLICDNNGNFYVTGTFTHTAIFDSTIKLTKTPGSGYIFESFLAKYDANGNVLWVRKLHGPAIGISYVTIDNASNPIIIPSGNTRRVLKMDGTNDSLVFGEMQSQALVKYLANGDYGWGKIIKHSQHLTFQQVLTDASDNIYMLGTMLGDTTFGSSNLSGGPGGIILKWSPSGTPLYGIKTPNMFYYPAFVYPDGRIVAVSEIRDSVDLGNGVKVVCKGPVTMGYRANIAIVFFDANLQAKWAVPEDRTTALRIAPLALATYGKYVYFGGEMSGGATKWGNITVDTVGANLHSFAVGMDTLGNINWAYATGSPKAKPIMFLDRWHRVLAMATDNNGKLFIAGTFADTIRVFDTSAVTGNFMRGYLARVTIIDTTGPNSVEIVKDFTASVYPNPASGKFYINFENTSGRPATAQIMDISGKMLVSAILNDGINELAAHAFSSGIYFIKITSGTETSVQKLVISY